MKQDQKKKNKNQSESDTSTKFNAMDIECEKKLNFISTLNGCHVNLSQNIHLYEIVIFYACM